jgi:hypothetical protein
LNRQRRNISLTILFLLGVFLMPGTGCVESVTDSSSSSSTTPTIEITSPVTGDTVYVGKNEITYSATDPSGSGLSSYKVYINGDLANTYSVSSTSTTTTIYLEIPSSLLLQKISYYVVAYSSSGKYKASKTQTAISVMPELPTPPGKLRIAKETNTQFNLTWVDSSDNESRFEVWRKDGSAGTYKLLKSLAENTFITEDVVASAYTVYFYKVRAGHSTGVSAFSNEVNTLIAPSNLAAKSTSATAVQLTWTDNSVFESGFRIERALASNSEFEVIGAATTDATTYEDKTALAGVSYIYRIAAYTSSAMSPYSSEVTIKTPTAESAPSDLAAEFNTTTRKVDLTWYSANGNITYIERQVSGSGQYTKVAVITNVLTRAYSDDSLLVAGTTYIYRIREYNSSTGLYTDYSNTASVYIPVLAPLAPSGLTIGKNSSLVYSLLWTDNSSDEEGFKLYRKAGSTGTYQYVSSFGANYDAGLINVPDASTIYYFKLTAYKGTLESDFSNEVCTSGTGTWALTCISYTKSSANLRWVDNFSDEVCFSLERKISGGTYEVINSLVPFSSGSGSYVYYSDTADDLIAGVTYYYRVRAKLNTGYSAYSNEISVTLSVL